MQSLKNILNEGLLKGMDDHLSMTDDDLKNMTILNKPCNSFENALEILGVLFDCCIPKVKIATEKFEVWIPINKKRYEHVNYISAINKKYVEFEVKYAGINGILRVIDDCDPHSDWSPGVILQFVEHKSSKNIIPHNYARIMYNTPLNMYDALNRVCSLNTNKNNYTCSTLIKLFDKRINELE